MENPGKGKGNRAESYVLSRTGIFRPLCDEITELLPEIGYAIATKKNKGGQEYVCCEYQP
jgi:hypothetical protein